MRFAIKKKKLFLCQIGTNINDEYVHSHYSSLTIRAANSVAKRIFLARESVRITPSLVPTFT